MRARLILAGSELEARGAEIVPFSPLRDERLPSGIRGLCPGGGLLGVYAAEICLQRLLCALLGVKTGNVRENLPSTDRLFSED